MLSIFLLWNWVGWAQPPQPATDAPVWKIDQGLRWRNIGPYRGGRAPTVAGVVDQPNVFYQGTAGGGVWKSDDAGNSWRNISDGYLGAGSIGAIAVAPSNPSVLYVGTGEGPARGQASTEGDGVYRSDDAGRRWRHVGLEDSYRISRIRVHPKDPNRLLVAAQGSLWAAGGSRGVYLSQDGGTSWQQVLADNDTTGAADLVIDPNNPRIVYAALWDHQRTPWQVRSGGPGSGLFKSTDGGLTWSKLEKGLPLGVLGKMGIAVSPADSSRLYAIVEGSAGGLYRSDDAGLNWRRVNERRLLYSRPWYFMKVYAHPTDVDTLFVLNMQMTRSIDGGRNFEVVPTPHGDNHDLWIHPQQPDWMINGNDGGANVSFNAGRSWSTQLNQPTGQFYRVATDALVPYNVYGSQQDNNNALRISSRKAGPGIDRYDRVGGGESGFVAFDPSDPRLIYAGANLNFISEYDEGTGQIRNIMAYPEQALGIDTRDLKYRFNWNAPIVVSPHDSSVIYHASERVLMTRDRGQSWEAISPDLTRNEVERHGPGGGPITNEAAGGENYNTITYLVESTHEPGVLWAGTDDGLLHLTRDGGRTWIEVTPPEIGEAQINSIEISPHDAGDVYVAVTGFRRGDRSPLILRGESYGQRWSRIVDGLPATSPTRVVRADPGTPGLLYAGTESGVFFSLDDGSRWKSLQFNLPVTPINDLAVQENDLIAATDGRGFWILDDLSPLQQIARGEVQRGKPHLFEPHPSYRWLSSAGNQAGTGENPPDGATLYYYLPEAVTDAVKLEILDAAGNRIRWFTSGDRPAVEAPGASPHLKLSSEAGLHRVIWDLRVEEITRVPGVFLVGVYFGTVAGYRVPPGQYEVRLTLAEESWSRRVQVLNDPHSAASQENYRQQHELLLEVRNQINDLHSAVIQMRNIRHQVQQAAESAGGTDRESIRKAAGELILKIEQWEQQLIQPRHEAVMDVVNFPTMLNEQFLFLKGAIAAGDGPPTSGARQRLSNLQMQWRRLKSEMQQLLNEEVARFNEMFQRGGVPAVRIP